jgi:hypothetical protein
MKKSKDPKAFKRAAFLSFLESPTTPVSEISVPGLSPSPSQKETAKTTEDLEDCIASSIQMISSTSMACSAALSVARTLILLKRKDGNVLSTQWIL